MLVAGMASSLRKAFAAAGLELAAVPGLESVIRIRINLRWAGDNGGASETFAPASTTAASHSVASARVG